MLHRFELDAYLERIAYTGPREPSRAVLDAVLEAHLLAIPFENLDVRLHRPVSLDLGALTAKLVRGGRGGYCFEQNALLAAALGELGFRVRTLEARVHPSAAWTPPRTHMTLSVDLPDGPRLADVGFGCEGPLRSVPLDGRPAQQPGGSWRVVAAEGTHLLQRWQEGAWATLYAFSAIPVFPIDFEVANHYTATWPRSRFVLTATVQWTTAAERHVLRGQTYTRATAEGEETRTHSLDEVVRLIRDHFGLRIGEAEARLAIGPAVTPASDQALLLSYGCFSPELQEDIGRLTASLRGRPPRGLLDLHPGYGSLLVRYDPRRTDPELLEETVRARLVLSREGVAAQDAPLVEIPVVYGGEHGPDLADVARETHLSEDAVVRLHHGTVYRVAFLGFTAGFPYLSGLPAALEVPRLPTPRRLVPAGSVAIAGRQAGIYPQGTPGGWNLIGRTTARLFRPEEEPITLLRMGDRVRFVPTPRA
jgi:KipI family sensor histidine kinase inhibitor